MRGAFVGRGARVAAVAALLAIAPGCGGCGQQIGYPPSFAFPARADRLVLKLPDKPAPAMNTAGKRDEEIAGLDALGGRTVDPATVPADARVRLEGFLKDAFGTPAEPVDVPGPLKLATMYVSEGAKLFKRHCVDCHNITGDGRGAKSGQFVVPYPRDYRQGAFKFSTSGDVSKPRRADLLRTLNDGLKGTAMPSFALLQDGERDLLAGYVIYLSIRGQVEFESLRALIDGQPDDPAARLRAVISEWEKADTAPPLATEPNDGEPESPAYQEAVRRGHQLFIAKTEDSCVTCHADYGRKPVLRYDVWGTIAKPASLTEPPLKAGSRPEDVYARVRYGIPSVGMPAHAAPKYTERDVWDLVRFVTAAPYRVKLPPDVRAAVYPNP